MSRRVAAALTVAAVVAAAVGAGPSVARAVSATSVAQAELAAAGPGWVPGFDEVAPAGASASVRTPAVVVTPDLRTVALWVDYPRIRGSVRPRGGGFGEPFELDPGNASYVPQWLDAVALPDGEVLAVWSSSGFTEMRLKSLEPDGSIGDARAPEIGGGYPVIAANDAGMVAVAYMFYNQVTLVIRPAGASRLRCPDSAADAGGQRGGGFARQRAAGAARRHDQRRRSSRGLGRHGGPEPERRHRADAHRTVRRGFTDGRDGRLPFPHPDPGSRRRHQRRVPRSHRAAARWPPVPRLRPAAVQQHPGEHPTAARGAAGRQQPASSSRGGRRTGLRGSEGARPDARRPGASLGRGGVTGVGRGISCAYGGPRPQGSSRPTPRCWPRRSTRWRCRRSAEGAPACCSARAGW